MLERSIARLSLERQNETVALFLRDYVENGSDWLWEVDEDLNLRQVSPRLAELVLQPQAELEGVALLDLLGVAADPPDDVPLVRLLNERSPFRNLSLEVRIGEDVRWWILTGRPVIGAGGSFEGYRGIGSDVTEARRAEERVRYLALHDSLTGLANRQSFRDRLAQIQERYAGGQDGDPACGAPAEACTVLLLDLDGFKGVNDSFGHAVGDELLVAVAERLRRCVRSETTVARLGGDEFGILTMARDAAEASALAQRIIDTVGQDYAVAGCRQTIGVSIGISFLGPDDSAPGDCIRRADLALYAAKAAGRGVYRVYHVGMVNAQHDRLALQADLRAAIRLGGLSLVFQPIFDVRNGGIASIEALCRWNHPAFGMIPPSRFIPIAEDTGLITELGEWMLTRACEIATSWPEHVRIAVNISPLEIKDHDFTSRLTSILSETGLPPCRLDLELTEHAYLDATQHSVTTIQALRGKGIRVILDDFGTGYSSLSYLASFQCDGIKIDASFIRDLDENSSKAAVVRAIAQLAADLRIPVTAEGVEKASQRDLLRAYDIRFAQGYFLQTPVNRATIHELLAGDAARMSELAMSSGQP
jgi:diguanylate cyclase (GGDEF)-like protein